MYRQEVDAEKTKGQLAANMDNLPTPLSMAHDAPNMYVFFFFNNHASTYGNYAFSLELGL